MNKLLFIISILILTACDSHPYEDFPPIERKAAKICLDADLVPDTHGTPYRCVISNNDPRLKD